MTLLPYCNVSKPTLAAVLAAGCMVSATLAAPAANAASFTLDFETDSAGNLLDAHALDTHSQYDRPDIGQLWADLGITITGTPKRGSAPLGLFNSSCAPKGGTSISGFTVACEADGDGDNDLATGKGSYKGITYDTAAQGNVLIFEENPGNGTPDDTAKGGEIRFDFDRELLSLVKIEEIGIIDDADGEIIVNYTDGSQFIQQITNTAENQLQFFGPDDKDVQDFIVRFTGSGAISGVVFSEFESATKVPEPMAILGFALMGSYGFWSVSKRNRERSEA